MVTKHVATGYISMKNLENTSKAQNIISAIIVYQNILRFSDRTPSSIELKVDNGSRAIQPSNVGKEEFAEFHKAYLDTIQARIEALNKELETL